MNLLQMKVVVFTAKIVLTLNTELTQPENKTLKEVGNIKPEQDGPSLESSSYLNVTLRYL